MSVSPLLSNLIPLTPSLLRLHLGSPQHLQLLFGFPKSAFPKQEKQSEEVPDSPELECRQFPQETWSVSCQGALDRQAHAHINTAARIGIKHRNGQSD